MAMPDDPAPRPQPPAPDGAEPTRRRPGHDVFVSYSSGDKAVADAIVARLEQAEIRCWVAPRDVMPGTLWGEAIVSAIERARLMVVVLSGAANQSRQVIREVERAVANDVVVVPFRIESIEPTGAMAYYLASGHWLDALTPPLETHIARLVGVAQAIVGITTAEPPAGTTEAPPPSPPPAARPPAAGEAAPSIEPAGAPTAPVVAPIAPAPPPVTPAPAAAAGRRASRSRILVIGGGGLLALLLAIGGAWSAGMGPFADDSGALPTFAPSDSPAAARTAEPTARPTFAAATMAPRFATVADDRALKAAVPSDVRATCETIDLDGARTAAIVCNPYGTLGVYYWRYATVADLVGDWSLLPTEEGVPIDSGGCSDGTEGEGPWRPDGGDGSEAGRVACFQTDGPVPVLTWTDTALRTRGWVFGTVGMGLDFLHGRWRDGAFGLDHALGALLLGVDGQAPIVPAGVRERCARVDPEGPQAAAVDCWTGDGGSVSYALYETREDLDADWSTLRAEHALAADAGERCGEGVASEASWSFPGDPAGLDRGRVLCANTGRDRAVLSWSSYAALTRVTLEGGSMTDLHAMWIEGGLDPVAPGD